MPNISASEINTQKHVREYVQFGGPGPTHETQYYGKSWQYAKVEGVSIPDGQGSIEPVWVHDPRYAGKFRLVARKVSAPDLAEASLVLLERQGIIPKALTKIGCAFNLYEPIGECQDLSDFLRGWSSYVLVYSGAIVDGNKDAGNRSSWGDSDDQLETTLPLKLSDIYPVGKINFGEGAANVVTLEVIDIVYGGGEQCGDCGPENDGTQWIYAVTKSSGSTPGTAPKFIYSVDGGANFSAGTIDGIGDIEDPIAIDVVGSYVVVVTRTAGGVSTGGYYYAEINSTTGAPGTWTKVTNGFAATFPPYDLYVLSTTEIFFCADGGVIYKSEDITVGVTVVSAGGAATNASLKRIHGRENTIVAVGNSSTVVKSTNRGKTWYSTTTFPVGGTLQAVAVMDDNLYWVGGSAGKMFYTLNGGETWVEKTFSGSGAGQVYDIVAVTDEVIWMSHSTAAPTARIFSTWNGGANWTNNAPRIQNLPVADRFNRIAAPRIDNAGVAVNNVALAGLAGDGSDGIILVGAATML